jgi:hypothetical protein
MINKVDCFYGVLFGADANNRSNAGLSSVNSYIAPSNSNANVSSHLWFSKVKNKIKGAMALPLGKKI